MSKIRKDWTIPDGDCIDVPDKLMPLFNKVGMQMRFCLISGKNEIHTIADIVEVSRQFFEKNPDLLHYE